MKEQEFAVPAEAFEDEGLENGVIGEAGEWIEGGVLDTRSITSIVETLRSCFLYQISKI